MSGVSIRIDGTTLALADLASIAGRLADQRPMWDEIGQYLENSTSLRFDQGKGPDGVQWPISWRAQKDGGLTLEDGGELRRTLQHNVLPNGVEFGSPLVYASIHQFGGTIKYKQRQQTLHFSTDKSGSKVLNKFAKKSKSNFSQRVTVAAHDTKMPARPFIGIDQDDESSILKIASSYIGGSDAD
jgi:phage gpG-like protein